MVPTDHPTLIERFSELLDLPFEADELHDGLAKDIREQAYPS